MKFTFFLSALALLQLFCCSTPDKEPSGNFSQQVSGMAYIGGKRQYLASPFITAGDRVYIVGYQDGSFPDLGWHVSGEMGGIWDHPIKLMDGFSANLKLKGSADSFCLNSAGQFVNYPLANRHYFTWEKENVKVERFQFVPDGVEGAVIEFRIINPGKEDKEMVFSFTGMTDLRPTWLGERTNMADAEDEISFDEKLSAFISKDKNNPWYTAFGSILHAFEFSEAMACEPRVRKGLGRNGTLSFSISLKANEEKTIPVFIAGSCESEESLLATYALLKKNGAALLAQKIARYKNIDNNAHLTIPDKNIEQMYEWLKYNVDWLARNVPEQGIGLSAGLPDYPWWFGADAVYSLQGALATGNHELAKNTIMLLQKISQQTNGNGRIIHEVSTNGSVYNPGNVNETAQFITLLLHYYQWTGDRELITLLFRDVKKGIIWLQEQDKDKNGYPDGNGMMEIPGLDTEMIDVAVYTQQGLASAAELARALGDHAAAATWQKSADELKIKINKEWWQSRENSFGDFRGTVAEAKPILEAAIVRADTLKKPWSVAGLKATQRQMKNYPSHERVAYVIYHNWVVNTPMETGIADPEKAKAALQTAKTYENPFGVFVTGIDRTEEPDSVVLKSRKKTFSYAGAVMTLPTGVLAVAAANYGSPEEVVGYLEKLSRSFSFALPGSMYEVSPDFGMMTQAWNIYGVAVPIVQHIFGIHPKAYEKSISLSPRLPLRWKDISIDHVRVGNNSLSLSISQKSEYTEYRVAQTQADWTLIVDVSHTKKVLINNKEMDLKAVPGNEMKLDGRENIVKIYF